MGSMQGECKMKQTDLGTTGSALVNQWQTGKPHGETGYAVIAEFKNRDPEDLLIGIPEWLLKIVPASTMLLVSYLNMKRQLPETIDKSEARSLLEQAWAQLVIALEPAEPTKILKAMEAVASVFNAALPDELGIKVYLTLLKDMPHIALQNSCIAVCATHKYSNMPLPSAFLSAGGPSKSLLESTKERVRLAINNLNAMQ
jgi:hypothetical protein